MGFHWTPCSSAASALGPIAIAIACLITAPYIPLILMGLVHAIIIGCFILAAGMVASSIVYVVLMRVLMPHVGGKYYMIPEARNEYEIQAEEWTATGHVNGRNRNREIPMPVHYSVLSRQAYEWQKDRQQQLPNGRNSRGTR